MCLTGRQEHITPVLKELHWLPVRQRISFKVLVLTYQTLHGTAPQYMTDLLSRYQPTRSLRSSDALLLTAPQSHLTSFWDRAFQHAAPTRLWNRLPISLRSANNLNSFKKLKRHFFSRTPTTCNVFYRVLAWTFWFILICITDPMDLFFSDAFTFFLNSYWCVCAFELLDLWEEWRDRNAA